MPQNGPQNQVWGLQAWFLANGGPLALNQTITQPPAVAMGASQFPGSQQHTHQFQGINSQPDWGSGAQWQQPLMLDWQQGQPGIQPWQGSLISGLMQQQQFGFQNLQPQHLPSVSWTSAIPLPVSSEGDFDKQFKEWEKKFLAWKEENKNHPDKKALAEYEAQWKIWREQLIQSREQIRNQQTALHQPMGLPQVEVAQGHPYAPPLFGFQQGNLLQATDRAFHGTVPTEPSVTNGGQGFHKWDLQQHRLLHTGPPDYRDSKTGLSQADIPAPRDVSHHLHRTETSTGIRPFPNAQTDAQLNKFEPEPFMVLPSGETAASMFRKRAMQGNGHELGDKGRPSLLKSQTFQEPSTIQGSRSRIEERLAQHADVKLAEGISAATAPKTTAAGVVEPATTLASCDAVSVFEYHHRPGVHGRFAVKHFLPVAVDYSHGKRIRLDPPHHNSYSHQQQHEVTPVDTAAREKIAACTAPPQLFPSAAAIQELEAQTTKNPTPLSTKLSLDGSGRSLSVVPEPPKLAQPSHEAEIVRLEDVLQPPGRHSRPSKIVVILRGLPGSGKSHTARLLKEKEISFGGSAPRILSIDDYYAMDDGSPVPWAESQEEQYRQNLIKSLRRNLEDGHFPFLIVDALHTTAREVAEVASIARGRTFAVYLVDLPERDAHSTRTRKCTDRDIEAMKERWQKAPNDIPKLNIGWLSRGEAAESVTADNAATSDDVVTPTVVLDEDSQEDSNGEASMASKWDTMEPTGEKLDRLDGLAKRKLEKPASMEDWLQSGLPDDYSRRKCVEGKKMVRWADVEEKLQQQKMRDLGFVVGQTDWSRMTDPTFGESALTKTKYI